MPIDGPIDGRAGLADGGSDGRDGFLRPARDGVGVSVRLTPKARRQGILGFEAAADGHVRCRVAVSAAPVDGKANAALLDLLAKQWRVPRSSLSIAAGAAARDKVVHVAGDPAVLLDRLRGWRDANR